MENLQDGLCPRDRSAFCGQGGIRVSGRSYLLSLTANRIATNLRSTTFLAHLHHLSLSFFNRRRTGAIMSTLTNDVPVLQNATMSLRDRGHFRASDHPCRRLLYGVQQLAADTDLLPVCIPFMATGDLAHQQTYSAYFRFPAGANSPILPRVIEETVSGVRIIKSFAAEDQTVIANVLPKRTGKRCKTVMHGILRSAQLRPLPWKSSGRRGVALRCCCSAVTIRCPETHNYQLSRETGPRFSKKEWRLLLTGQLLPALQRGESSQHAGRPEKLIEYRQHTAKGDYKHWARQARYCRTS